MSTETLKRIPLADILPSKTNPRKTFTTPDWPEFVESVRTHGVLQPGVGRDTGHGKIELVAGERRYRASKEAGLKDMPLILRELTDAQVIEIQQIENLQRADLTPLEEAQGYADWRDGLLKAGTVKTVEEAVTHIAAKINRKRTAVYAKLALLKLAPPVAEALKAGKLDQSKAGLIAQIPDAKVQATVLKEVISPDADVDAMSYRELREHIEENFRVSLKGAPFSLSSAFITVKLDGKSAPSCLACPYRTGNMPNAEGDVNVCTQPQCFRDKCALVASTKVPGIAGVWTDKEFRDNRYSSAYVCASDRCYDYSKNRTWEALLGKFAPPAFLAIGREYSRQRDGDGNEQQVLRYFKKTEALKAAHDNGLLKAVSKDKTPSKEEMKEKQRRAEEKAKEVLREQQMSNRIHEIIGCEAGEAEKKNPGLFWRNLALTALALFSENYSEEEIFAVMKGHGMAQQATSDARKNLEIIRKTIETTPLIGNLPGYTLELMLRTTSTWNVYGSNRQLSDREKLLALWPKGKDAPAPKKPTPPAVAKIAAKAKAAKVKPAKKSTVKKGGK